MSVPRSRVTTVRPTAWITWERHRRTRELSHAFDAELWEFTSNRSRLARYVVLIARTIVRLLRRRPALVFVQCPSVVLGYLLVLLKPVLGYRLVADLHNAGVRAIDVTSPKYDEMLRRLHREADLCIVSNPYLAPVVEFAGGRAFVLPDKLPRATPGFAASPRGAPGTR